MAMDTPTKRFSAQDVMMPWRGIHSLPDGTVGARDKQALVYLYAGILATAPATTAAITGTATVGITEADVVAGGKTIIITLTNDTWVAVGAAFNAQRQAIINGLDSAQSEPAGWNAAVRDLEVVTAVVRTSDTVVTVTLTAATYNITAPETITVTVPSTALVTSLVDVTAAPTFDVSVVAVAVAGTAKTGTGGIDPGVRRVPFKPTGLRDRPKQKGRLAEREANDARVVETEQISAEIAARLAREFAEENAASAAAEIQALNAKMQAEAEIKALLAKRRRTEDEELLLLILMAADI